MIKRICIFGASIAFGSGDTEFGGWQNHLKVWFVKRGKFQHIFNLAISGRTTTDIISRFKNELLVRKSANSESEIMTIIAIPSNDARFVIVSGKKEFEISKEQFVENLEKITELNKEYADRFMFVGITKVVDTKTNPWYKADNGVSWKNEIIKEYNKIVKEFCEKNNILFCPVFDLLEDKDLPDGLHPNAKGHKKMFERIKDFLIENKIIK